MATKAKGSKAAKPAPAVVTAGTDDAAQLAVVEHLAGLDKAPAVEFAPKVYPCYVFAGPDGAPVYVQSVGHWNEIKADGREYADSPAAFGVQTAPAKTEEQSL